MKLTIEKTMLNASVVEASNRLRLSEDKLWNIYYNSGDEYLNCLQELIKRKRFFDALFGAMIGEPGFGKMNLVDVFSKIRKSTAFWAWWSSQFWSVCRENKFRDSTELFYRLQFNDSLIPFFILKHIFNGNQNLSSGKTKIGTPENEIAEPFAAARTARKRARNEV